MYFHVLTIHHAFLLALDEAKRRFDGSLDNHKGFTQSNIKKKRFSMAIDNDLKGLIK